MSEFNTRLMSLIAGGALLLTVPKASAASQLPCQMLPAEAWSRVMGYTATATPGDGNCTYVSKSGGGQFRILLNASSGAEAKATAKRFRDHQARGSHHAGLAVVDSQGTVVFSIALFQREPTDSTASQLKKLAEEAKKHIAN